MDAKTFDLALLGWRSSAQSPLGRGIDR